APRFLRAGWLAAHVREGRGDRSLVFGEALAILLGGGLLAAPQPALQFDLQQLTKEGAALVAGAGQVVAEVRAGVAAPGLLEERAGAVDALERVERQRLGPVACHGGGSGHFLLPATSDEIQFALDGAANAIEPARNLLVGIAFHFQQGNGTEVLVR